MLKHEDPLIYFYLILTVLMIIIMSLANFIILFKFNSILILHILNPKNAKILQISKIKAKLKHQKNKVF